jgi:DNA-binding HxlR family transcriptional regulator
MTKSSPRRVARDPKLPLPGRAVAGSSTGRPVMAALSLFSRRWVLRVIWELRDGALGFRELQQRCERMSPDTLSTRLGELKTAGIVGHDEKGNWTLTPLGRELGPAMEALSKWSQKWAAELGQQDKRK